MDNYETGIYTDNPDDTLRYMKTTVPVDYVQVVRCKDCKWSYDAIGGTFCSHGVCVDCVVYDDWFCPMGERRTDDVQKTD